MIFYAEINENFKFRRNNLTLKNHVYDALWNFTIKKGARIIISAKKDNTKENNKKIKEKLLWEFEKGGKFSSLYVEALITVNNLIKINQTNGKYQEPGCSYLIFLCFYLF